MPYLLKNVSVDTDGDLIKGDGSKYELDIWATSFGGGTVNIEISPDNGTTWILATYGGNPASFSENKALHIEKVAHGEYIRATLTGSTGADNVNAIIFT